MNQNRLKLTFMHTETNRIVYPISCTFNTDGSIETVTGFTADNSIPEIYSIDSLTVFDQYLQIPNIGRIYPGDVIKLNENDKEEYILEFGWYNTNEGLDLYGWYLHTTNIIKPFYKNYIKKIEVVKFQANK